LEAAIMRSVYFTIPNDIGACDVPCEGCGALHWLKESTINQRDNEKIFFSNCFQKGKVSIPSASSDAPKFPPTLQKLIVGKKSSKSFQRLSVSATLKPLQELKTSRH
jgi:hypothetical protein